MAKTGGWCRKLTDKKKANASHHKLGRQTPLSKRIDKALTYSAKHVALLEHKRAIHGLTIHGVVVDKGGRNPGPAECFPGDGLPDDSLASLKPPKTNAERAAADKRNSLKSEMRAGWLSRTPSSFRPHDPVRQALANLKG